MSSVGSFFLVSPHINVPIFSAPPKLLSGLNSESKVALGDEARLKCQVYFLHLCPKIKFPTFRLSAHHCAVLVGWSTTSQWKSLKDFWWKRRWWRRKGRPTSFHPSYQALPGNKWKSRRTTSTLPAGGLPLTKWVTCLLSRMNTEDMMSGLDWAVEFEEVTSSTRIAVTCKLKSPV